MKKRIIIMVAILLVGLFFFTSSVGYAINQSINLDNLDKGVISVSHTDKSDAKYLVMVKIGEKKVTYPFRPDGTWVSFPLQFGNGTYKIGLLKNISGKRYAYVWQENVTLSLKDDKVVYLNPIQNIYWQEDYESVQYGLKLTDKKETIESVTASVYEYMVNHIVYDYDKISTLTSSYVPSVESTYKEQKGICYDYSSLMAAILRSQGYPTRLVKGYATAVEGYHAWNEVWIDGEWKVIDTTVDASLGGSIKKMFKKLKDYKSVNHY